MSRRIGGACGSERTRTSSSLALRPVPNSVRLLLLVLDGERECFLPHGVSDPTVGADPDAGRPPFKGHASPDVNSENGDNNLRCLRAGEPVRARFCLACGTPLAAEAAARPTEERRVVTALFVDLVGSTRLAEQLDPEDVLALLELVLRPPPHRARAPRRHGREVHRRRDRDAIFGVAGRARGRPRARRPRRARDPRRRVDDAERGGPDGARSRFGSGSRPARCRHARPAGPRGQGDRVGRRAQHRRADRVGGAGRTASSSASRPTARPSHRSSTASTSRSRRRASPSRCRSGRRSA